MMIWNCRNQLLDLSHQAHVMGILNITPDSFSDGGSYTNLNAALQHAQAMIQAGASIIDVGGESTRPGAMPVTEEEEKNRVLPVIQALRKEWNGFISIDTQKAAVAEAALALGANIVNDVSGLLMDPEMLQICAQTQCGLVIMHMQGTPQTMQKAPHYESVLDEMNAFFKERIQTCLENGISREAICIDPGIGFGKTLDHNIQILRNLEQFQQWKVPVLLGVSKKSMLQHAFPHHQDVDRSALTVAVTCDARKKGIMLHRVHDVAANFQALKMIEHLL